MDDSNKTIGGIPPALERLTGLVLISNGNQLRFTMPGRKLLKGMLAYYGFNIADIKTITHYEIIREIAISNAALDLQSDKNPNEPAHDLPALIDGLFNTETPVDKIFSELRPDQHLKLVPSAGAKPLDREK
ncbi:MAG: hypothetical protein JWM78_1873 [Verrucomicrobiaceae bacterium]|nr:hypothetical protein [Verrucomicrobiaceae bacterium]